MATTSSVMEAVEKTDVAKAMSKRARLALVDFHGVIENLSEGLVFLLKCGPEKMI